MKKVIKQPKKMKEDGFLPEHYRSAERSGEKFELVAEGISENKIRFVATGYETIPSLNYYLELEINEEQNTLKVLLKLQHNSEIEGVPSNPLFEYNLNPNEAHHLLAPTRGNMMKDLFCRAIEIITIPISDQILVNKDMDFYRQKRHSEEAGFLSSIVMDLTRLKDGISKTVLVCEPKLRV
jgi:hypothetical protein